MFNEERTLWMSSLWVLQIFINVTAHVATVSFT